MNPGAIEAQLRELVAELVREEVDRRLAAAPPAPAPAEHMTAAETAAYLKIATITLEQMRARGKGPPYRKAGRRVIYRRDDVDAWLKAGGGRR